MSTTEAQTQTLYVAQNWLDDTSTTTSSNVTVSVGYNDSGGVWTTYYPYYTTQYWWPYTVVEKIRLKLSEVETLRTAAKRNKALKNVLQKFGPHIEIEVDFP